MNTSQPPRTPHVLLGAYVLGGLPDDEAHLFADHLSSCPICRQELDAAQRLPRLLSLLDTAQLKPGAGRSRDRVRRPPTPV